MDQNEEGTLSSIIRDNQIFLGGSSMGKGFRRAARYYLRYVSPLKIADQAYPVVNDNAALLNHGVAHQVEDPFYVLDIGMVVSQLYQWKQYFPRVEPFYAVKCNPDKVILQTLAKLGCHFDCASRNEIRLVQELTAGSARTPEIVYANPCKSRSHIIEAVCRGVTLMTFDNPAEVKKCASVSNKIRLLLRIITDDSGSQCRLSSKFGAPKSHWNACLKAAKHYGLQVVGVSFHVGSGCREASRYEWALNDAREVFDVASKNYGFDMNILDIGGGFPGETHSLWNPAEVFGDVTGVDTTTEIQKRKYSVDAEIDEESTINEKEGINEGSDDDEDEKDVMYFDEIAEEIVPIMDRLFPAESGVRIIAEPGRFLVAACATLCTNIIAVRSNATTKDPLTKISDSAAAYHVDQVTREEEDVIVEDAGNKSDNPVMDAIVEEIADYSKLFARLNFTQQEVDVYTEEADFSKDHVKPAAPLLAPPKERLLDGESAPQHHTVEGMQIGIVANCLDDGLSVVSDTETQKTPLEATIAALSLAAAGEAAVSGVVLQAIADSSPCQDDFSYYVNDGCYGAMNNLIYDHATVRPRRLKNALGKNHKVVSTERNGFMTLEAQDDDGSGNHSNDDDDDVDDGLYPSTVFGPTCDSIDVIARNVLLPKLDIGSWLYFQNMGAYTSAAAGSFNGFTPTETFYCCSVQPEHFQQFFKREQHSPTVEALTQEEKKE
mmetsp:Transcript_19505/g.29344  ORF Transcript_19505/g.29344 Transcript_19505/m.29344 type:complete len:719 (-) Transcript_19505:122-2278(-)|eukprot:CAMPEP_0178929714 /NCGR_PEP_ID=MMETSP0786-20121207/20782_1 /TAXON_ID=186022 /ORGANISM="Thalassionema frauenfeldii, Strain CCMP 1798" /LENGTH=718 /DNA_ID=CAMNT_0020606059 /DNA_START=149 /DNA_END=2305 /DNA_ORIENTATION=+